MICGCDDVSSKQQKLCIVNFDNPMKTMKGNLEPIVFKVVVHLCFETYHLDFYEKEIEYAIDELNKDFAGRASKANPYIFTKHKDTFNKYAGMSSDAKITFVLDKVIYKPIPPQTSVNINILNERIKKFSVTISPEDTLNIWIADLPNIHGYAQYPWDLKEHSKLDGVVISRGVFGRSANIYRFSQGKVLTHMVGHWLGLTHVFYKDDIVNDLPHQQIPTFGDPLSTIHVWPMSDELHMYMNFMDFTDDVSSFMFTKGQIEKMRSTVYIYRQNLVAFPTTAPRSTVRKVVTVKRAEIILKDIWEHHIEKDNPQRWKLITRINKVDAKIMRNKNNETGITLKRHAAAEICVDMSNTTHATLTVSIKDALPNTTAMFKTKDGWKRTKIKNKTDDWENITIPMPGPFGSAYYIRFQASNANQYTWFDHLIIKKTD
jgi:Pregnancy-associated plasma protein-A